MIGGHHAISEKGKTIERTQGEEKIDENGKNGFILKMLYCKCIARNEEGSKKETKKKKTKKEQIRSR